MHKKRTNRAPSPWRGLISMALCAALVVALAGTLTQPAAAQEEDTGSKTSLAAWVTSLARSLGNRPASAQPLAQVALPKDYSQEDWTLWHQLREDNPVSEEFLAVQDRFAYATAVQVMGQTQGNVSYSPLSLYYALALAATGGEGETAQELLTLLGAEDQETLAAQCGNLYRQLYRDNELGVLRIANSLWMDQGVAWKEPFVTQAAQDFYAQVFQEDFSDPATAQKMAAWVASQTGGLLQPEIDLDSQQILSILNTVYFRDQWVDEFRADRTQPDTFTRADGTQVTCDFMNRTNASGGFYRGENYLRASLGLKNAGAMTFVLPDEGTDLQALLSDPAALQEALTGGQSHSGELVWKIPKFDSSCTLSLTQALQRLGVTHAFQPDGDFSAITDQPAWISSVQQQTRVTIDEEGVAAAAFTAIDYAGAAMPEDRAEMILDRPFLYAITSPCGNLLFLGICQDPTA